MLRRPLPLTVALALVVGVSLLAVLSGAQRRVAGAPAPYCTVLSVLFDTDGEMRRVAAELRRDGRVREVRDERTKSANHDRVTARLREEGRFDLADATRVGSTPASVRVVEGFGVDPAELAGELRQRFRVNLVDACAEPGAWDR
ncbi:hypothetical protein [Saccharothrix sp. HUAS TT1]|uniref:hypothetical protein n=1 Tax=unclassified Saccharothrix TaxID=2593673 RepID=UPI00345C3898